MFQAVQIAYWLALSTWFGALVFIAVAAPIIFRTVRDADPTLPKVLSVNLEGQHSTLLAGTIVGNLLNTLTRVQLICAAVLLPVIGIQWFLISRTNVVTPLLRSAAFIAATIILIYHWWIVAPRTQKYRDQYIEHADEPDVANPALDQFDRYNKENETILLILLALILLMILFSGDIRPSSVTISFQ